MRVVQCLLLVFLAFSITAVHGEGENRGAVTVHQAASATLRAISNAHGWAAKDLRVAELDREFVKVARGNKYDFTLGVKGKSLDFTLSEETLWEELALPELPSAGGLGNAAEEGSVGVWEPVLKAPVLPDFEVAGPVELWLEDAKDIEIRMPHDVDAGFLNRVVVADGAAVTIKGAREVSLAKPLRLPLPLSQGVSSQEPPLGSGLLGLAARVRSAARRSSKPLVGLRVVGAESLTAAGVDQSRINRLKVKRLAPGAVEVSARQTGVTEGSPLAQGWAWPFSGLNSTDRRLAEYESLLGTILGPEVHTKGSFDLVKAKAQAVALVQFQFQVERQVPFLKDNTTVAAEDKELGEEVMTVDKQRWEAVVKLEGGKLEPVSARQTGPVPSTVSHSFSVQTRNGTLVAEPAFLPPMGALNIDVDWSAYA